MAKQMVFQGDARDAVRRGVEKLAKAVTTTLGPRGRNAVLDKGWGAPTITKDGVSVAEEVQLQDPYEQMGASLVKEVASKTSDVAGDGTTTATLLTSRIFSEGLKAITAGAAPARINQALSDGSQGPDIARTLSAKHAGRVDKFSFPDRSKSQLFGVKNQIDTLYLDQAEVTSTLLGSGEKHFHVVSNLGNVEINGNFDHLI